MSRETDNPSPSPGDGAGASDAPEEKKTETTVTKRVRIDIPGSRPIPPVVVREKVEGETPTEDSPTPSPPPDPDTGRTEHGAETGAQEKVSDWFQPRKPVPATETPPEGSPTPPPSDPGQPASEPDGPASGALPRRETPEPLTSDPFPGPIGTTSGPTTGEMPLPPAGPQPRSEPPLPPVAGGSPLEEGLDGTDEFGRSTLDLGGPVPRPAGHVGYTHESAPPAGIAAYASPDAFPDLYAPGTRNSAGPGASPGGSDDGDAVQAERRAEQEPPARGGKLRSRLVLAAVAVGGVLVLAYGAGLLLKQDDVPSGTTVLGHDIGGMTDQEATNQLDEALAGAIENDLTLEVDGTSLTMPPRIAGLDIDTEATVGEASGTDYHPVTVLGSLAGQGRQVNPVYTVDEEKLAAALEDVTDGIGGEPVEGGINLDNGVAEPQYGESGTGIDIDAALETVEQAFQERAETGQDAPVVLDTTTVEHRVSDAEVDRAMEEFAEPAMSGMVTVSAGNVAIQFSPENSLHLFLSMRPTDDGRLVDHYDLEALEELYGTQFDGIEVQRADGSATPVTPEDVAGALREALLETAPEQRVGIIELDAD